MAKASNDLFSTLRTYISKLSEGERSPQEIAVAINGWARDSAEALRAKIHEEVEASVTKMGFIKRAEFDRLAAEVAKLSVKTAPAKKKSAQKSTAQKSAVKKSAAKKNAPKRVVKR